MPSNLDAFAASARRPENVSILVAVGLAIPAAAAVDQWLHWEGLGFLVLLGLGVVVPTTFREHWRGQRTVRGAAVWTVVACAVGTVALVGGTVLLGAYAGVPEFVAAAVAFLVVGLGGSALVWQVGRRWMG